MMPGRGCLALAVPAAADAQRCLTSRQEHGVGDGVRREWFHLLAAELAVADLGLFETHDGGATLAPAPHSTVQCDGPTPAGHLRAFELVGCMVGLGLQC